LEIVETLQGKLPGLRHLPPNQRLQLTLPPFGARPLAVLL
jgi:hypothetical protein